MVCFIFLIPPSLQERESTVGDAFPMQSTASCKTSLASAEPSTSGKILACNFISLFSSRVTPCALIANKDGKRNRNAYNSATQ